ncbi:MAG: hypothetical protein KJN76_08560 [Eudoraea sp.]|nr:hypothetical protein [Eudoraea sp.]
MDIAVEKLGKITENSNFIEVDPPLFPLAKNRESHLVCTGIKTVDGLIENAVFTFADDQLVYIEARGNAVEVFTLSRKDTATTYLDYSFYEKEKLILNKEKDIAWVMNNEGMHLNLFTWENPYLENSIVQAPPATPTRNLPAFIKMGATIDEMKPLIAANSKFISVEELNGDDPNAQIQINGFGVHYMGFPRKIEARFGDNKLNVVWILTGKGEEERVREALTGQFGKPVYLNDEWEIYNNWQVGLRKDKPEVLLMEKQIGLAYKSSYFGQ